MFSPFSNQLAVKSTCTKYFQRKSSKAVKVKWFFLKIYLVILGGRGKRERKKESWANSLLGFEPKVGLNFRTLRSWPKPKSGVRRLTDWALQRPQRWRILETNKIITQEQSSSTLWDFSFYWSLVDTECFISFRCTIQWFNKSVHYAVLAMCSCHLSHTTYGIIFNYFKAKSLVYGDFLL